jgi:hypothetical protein
VKNCHAWTPRLTAGLGSLVLMLGILAAFQYGTPRAAARTGVALRASGGSASRVVTTSYTATSGLQYCRDTGEWACLNAWGGGPWVDVYTGGVDRNDSNQQFTVIVTNAATNAVEIEFTGGSAWNGKCVGDAYNGANYADTSLDPCGTGWGTNFTEGSSGCSQGEYWFKNAHWTGYLGPSSSGFSNGSHFYLNNRGKTCFGLWTD